MSETSTKSLAERIVAKIYAQMKPNFGYEIYYPDDWFAEIAIPAINEAMEAAAQEADSSADCCNEGCYDGNGHPRQCPKSIAARIRELKGKP